MSTPRPLRPAYRAVSVAVLYGLFLYALVYLGGATPSLPFLAGLFGVPAAVAACGVILHDPEGGRGAWQHAGIGALSVLLLIVLSIPVFGEGGICVAMASPLLLVSAVAGALVTGRLLNRGRRRALPSLMVVLPFLGLPVDATTAYPERAGTVTTTMEIAAPPAAIWRNTVAIAEIDPGELGWTFSHAVVGVPRPIDARLAGEGPGAVRHLRWDRGIHFEEHVEAWEEDRRLSWRFRFAPDSIPSAVEAHIRVDSPYLRLLGGEYRLDPVGDGRTRLTLSTHYRIATPINGYCAWWGGVFLDDFHRTVLGVIRARSEAGAARTAGPTASPATPG